MKKIEPVLTEKSLAKAKEGQYTFRVSVSLNKNQARQLVEKTFGVDVVSISSMNTKAAVKRNYLGRKKKTTASKKIVVGLKEKQKIDLFEEVKK